MCCDQSPCLPPKPLLWRWHPHNDNPPPSTATMNDVGRPTTNCRGNGARLTMNSSSTATMSNVGRPTMICHQVPIGACCCGQRSREFTQQRRCGNNPPHRRRRPTAANDDKSRHWQQRQRREPSAVSVAVIVIVVVIIVVVIGGWTVHDDDVVQGVATVDGIDTNFCSQGQRANKGHCVLDDILPPCG